MKAILTSSRLFLLGLLAAAGCVGAAPSTVHTTKSALTTACQQAQDDCTSRFDMLAAEGASLATTCQTDVGQACQAGPSTACTQAQTACQNAVAQLQQDTANATAACNSEVSTSCDPGSGAGSGSAAGSGSGSGGSGAGSGAPSSACLVAIASCEQDTQTLLQGASFPDCGDPVITACSDPANASGCQSAIQACTGDVQNLQSQAGSDAAQCAQDIASACP